MLKILGWAVAYVLGAALLALALYVNARIMAPEFGLDVPSYQAWFWSSAFGIATALILGAIKGALFD